MALFGKHSYIFLLNIFIFPHWTCIHLYYLKYTVNFILFFLLLTLKTKSLQKAELLCDSVYITFWKRQNYRDRKQICGRWEPRVGKGLTTNRHRDFESDNNVLYLDCGDSYMIVCGFQNSQNWTLRTNFIVYKNFLSKSEISFLLRVWIISQLLLFLKNQMDLRR